MDAGSLPWEYARTDADNYVAMSAAILRSFAQPPHQYRTKVQAYAAGTMYSAMHRRNLAKIWWYAFIATC